MPNLRLGQEISLRRICNICIFMGHPDVSEIIDLQGISKLASRLLWYLNVLILPIQAFILSACQIRPGHLGRRFSLRSSRVLPRIFRALRQKRLWHKNTFPRNPRRL